MTKPTKPTLKKARRDWKTPFLNTLRKSPDVSGAAKAARVDRSHVYSARKDDAEFASAWDDAINQSLDAAEGELYRRAVTGIKKPVTVAGRRVDIREYSDTLLIFMLKAHRPAIYRETVNQRLTGGDGGPIEVKDIDAIRRKRWAEVTPALAAAATTENE